MNHLWRVFLDDVKESWFVKVVEGKHFVEVAVPIRDESAPARLEAIRLMVKQANENKLDIATVMESDGELLVFLRESGPRLRAAKADKVQIQRVRLPRVRVR